jgi:hypothetical protein
MRFHHERDENGNYTGITVCDLDGIQGFSFCYLTHFKKELEIFTNNVTLVEHKGDQFNKKIGRKISQGRAEKLKELMKDMPLDVAMEKLYTHRMRRKINEYMERNQDLYK